MSPDRAVAARRPCFWLALTLPAANGQITYRLEVLGGQIGGAFLNDSEQMAGSLGNSASMWSRETGTVILGRLPYPYNGQATAVDINNIGHVTGEGVGLGTRGFLWTPANGMEQIGPDWHARPRAINDFDQIIGETFSPGQTHIGGFYWDLELGTIVLPFLPNQVGGIATGINNSGYVCGIGFFDDKSWRGFYWAIEEVIQGMGPMPNGDVNVLAEAISNEGLVTGLAIGVDRQYSYVWSAAGGYEVIAETAGLLPDAGCWLINDRGEVLGEGAWEQNQFEAYIYVAGSGRPLRRLTRRLDPCLSADLRSTFADRFAASDLNNLGQISGGLDLQTPNMQTVLLTPYIAGDPDFDGDTDLYDLAVTLAHFGEADPSLTFAEGDVDEDADVDLADLAHVLVNFGRRCPTP